MVIYNDNMRLKLTRFITINSKANIKFALIHKYLLYNSTFYYSTNITTSIIPEII